MKVLAHPQNAADSKALLKAGIDGLLHLRLGPDFDDEAIRMMKERNVLVTPVLGLGEMRGERVFDDPFLQETVTPDVLKRLSDAFAKRPAPSANAAAAAARRQQPMKEAFAKLIAADVQITLGADSGGLPDHFFGWADHRERGVGEARHDARPGHRRSDEPGSPTGGSHRHGHGGSRQKRGLARARRESSRE